MRLRLRDPLIVFAVTALFAGGAWLAGFATALYVAPDAPATPEGANAPSNFGLFAETWRIVKREFYGDMPVDRKITYRAVEGMVETLDDPYAAFLARDEAAASSDQFQLAMADGLGAWFEPVANGALVMSVVPDTPAQHIGLQPSDLVLAVDREPLAGKSRATILAQLDGPAGSSVLLVVQRGRSPPRAVEAVRDNFELPAVEVRRPRDGVAYVRLPHFASGIVEELDEALRALDSEAPGGLVLDLRDNPGGNLERARQVAGRFVAGELYVEVDRQGRETVQRAETPLGSSPVRPRRLVVLVNGGTVDAAEMVAAALQEAAGAQLVGEQTFGKGSIQAVKALGAPQDGSLLRLTVAEWRTPAGRVVEGVGLEPDVTIALSAEDVDAGRDPQLETALRLASGAATARGG